jgi:plasmid stabilization system protein ParE
MKTIRFLFPAEFEMLEAARYYQLQAAGLGLDFLNKIDSAVRDIAQDPERWPFIRPLIRRRLIHRFLYSLIYRIVPDEVLILATMHLHRRPDYWIDR